METAAATLLLSLDAVIVAVTDEAPRILCIDAGLDQPSLPTGLFNHEQHPTIERGLRHWVREQSGVELGYVEQLYTFGDRYRDPRERSGGARVVSVAYLTLLHEQALPAELTAHWRDWYEFLPWEDWREGRPAMIERRLRPALKRWSASNRERQQRVQSCFGSDKTPWDPERTLERYELLWEAGVVAEALRDGGSDVEKAASIAGQPMFGDHRRILATALGRLRGKLRYRPVVFELLPETFTLLRLQRVVEALAGTRLHKQNFRRLVEQGGLVEGTGRLEHGTGGRPAELFRFRGDVLRERPAPGVYFPGAFWSR